MPVHRAQRAGRPVEVLLLEPSPPALRRKNHKRYALFLLPPPNPPPLRQLERTHHSLLIMSRSSMHWTDQREKMIHREIARERERELERDS